MAKKRAPRQEYLYPLVITIVLPTRGHTLGAAKARARAIVAAAGMGDPRDIVMAPGAAPHPLENAPSKPTGETP